MNIKMLEQVEQWLLAGAPERKFDMNVLVDDVQGKENWCGTSCCIAGYVFQQTKAYDAVIKKDEPFFQWNHDIEQIAADALGMDKSEAYKLFFVRETGNDYGDYQGDWEKITPAQAAQAVRNVIDHGTPMWETILNFEDVDY
jgi:hypothetical protein